MSRNGSGTYTIPNTFTTGTTISSTSMNTNFSDISTALTGSVASNGETTITAPIKFSAGSAGSPSITYSGNTNTGLYWSATNELSVSLGGNQKYIFTTTGLTATGMALNIGTGALTAGAGTFGNYISWQMSGQTNAARLGQVSDFTTYGALSFNATYTAAGMCGIFGAGGADTALYLTVPTGKTVQTQVANSTVTSVSSTGLSVTGYGEFIYTAGVSDRYVQLFNKTGSDAVSYSAIRGAVGSGLSANLRGLMLEGSSVAVSIGASSGTSSSVIGTFSSTGLAVTGALSATAASASAGLQDITFQNTTADGYTRVRWGNNVSAARATATLRGSTVAGGERFIIGSEGNFPVDIQTAGAVAATLDASGNLGIGVTPTAAQYSGTKYLEIGKAGQGIVGRTGSQQLEIMTNCYYNVSSAYSYATTGRAAMYAQASGAHYWYYDTGTPGAGNATNFTAAMTLDASGNLLVGEPSTGNAHMFSTSTNNVWAFYVQNKHASTPNGIRMSYPNADPNGVNNQFLYCSGGAGATLRAEIRSNGGLANFSANNVNLSDIRTKKDINLAGNYLDKICAIPVKTFLYKDQTDDQLNLGVIAQDVEAIAPELVDVSGFGETPEDGIPLKSIYQTDLQYALMKAIQELSKKVFELEKRIPQ